jgi:hypothetical protein
MANMTALRTILSNSTVRADVAHYRCCCCDVPSARPACRAGIGRTALMAVFGEGAAINAGLEDLVRKARHHERMFRAAERDKRVDADPRRPWNTVTDERRLVAEAALGALGAAILAAIPDDGASCPIHGAAAHVGGA